MYLIWKATRKSFCTVKTMIKVWQRQIWYSLRLIEYKNFLINFKPILLLICKSLCGKIEFVIIISSTLIRISTLIIKWVFEFLAAKLQLEKESNQNADQFLGFDNIVSEVVSRYMLLFYFNDLFFSVFVSCTFVTMKIIK